LIHFYKREKEAAMETLLEQQRRYHEERERLMDGLVQERLMEKKSHKDGVNSEHRQKSMLERYDECTAALREIYEDKDGLRKEEITALSGPNEFAEFYSRLKGIKDFHRRHPGEVFVPMSVEFDELKKIRETSGDDANNMVEFSDEEGYGKFLDLHECYDKFINLKGVDRMDYINYITSFDQLYDIPRDKKGGEYRIYLTSLFDYLYGFISRTRPLLNIDQQLEEIEQGFGGKFERGECPGWAREQVGAMAHTGAHLDLSAFSSPEELSTLGLDRLKSALIALGLKCGGTLQERSERLFLTKGRKLSDLNPNIFAKTKPGKEGRKDGDKLKDIAKQEAYIYRFAELLADVRNSTVENVERKQARTDAEREESDDEDVVEEVEEEPEDDIPYNPKNLPLGWDGKPIPYWLYKLHGLNISYNCEICGNFTYKGPKAFQRHFAEWRHAHGMRCLGIPNTAHFANVTQIEDAMALWEKLKVQKFDEAWKPDHEEEYEDSKGNVVNKKTYDDLKRQGLL